MTARDRMTTFEDAGLWMQYWARNEKQRPQSATLSGKHSCTALLNTSQAWRPRPRSEEPGGQIAQTKSEMGGTRRFPAI